MKVDFEVVVLSGLGNSKDPVSFLTSLDGITEEAIKAIQGTTGSV